MKLPRLSFRPLVAVLALGAAGWLAATPSAADEALVRSAEAKRIAAINKVRPAVVAVFSANMDGGGSGVIIDPEGYALTNFHVVGVGPVMKCGLPDGELYDSVLVGLDKVGDVGLIKLLPKEPGKPFPYVPLGDSDKTKPGDWSMAMGNPFLLATDFTPTVTFGLVSGTSRYQYPSGNLLEYTDCIQIDTSINPGNSGGPLFNTDGELIGINGRGSFEKRGRVNSGVGYAISINQIKNFMGHLYAGIDTDHATLGATVEISREDEDSVRPTMLVKSILDNSDAYHRGLRPDDELVAFAGRSMQTINQYKNVLGVYPKGWRMPLSYRRDNEKKEILVRLMGLADQQLDEAGRPKEPDQPTPRPGPRPQPKGPNPAPAGPSPAMKLFKARKGFANYYFNEQASGKLLAGFKKHGDFSGLEGEWTVTGSYQLKDKDRNGGFTAKVGEKDGKTVVKMNLRDLEYGPFDPLKKDQDVRDMQEPPGSGGLMLALYHYRRLLAMGTKGFEASSLFHGGREPFYPYPADGTKPKSLKDLRVEAEVLHTEHAAVEARWFFAPKDQSLMGFEVYAQKDEDPCEVYLSDYRAVDGRQVPFRIEVRYGDDRYGVFTVTTYQLAAK